VANRNAIAMKRMDENPLNLGRITIKTVMQLSK